VNLGSLLKSASLVSLSGKARGLDLLPTVNIDIADLGDVRDLVKQSQKVQAAGFETTGGDGSSRPADVAFDLLDKVID